MPGLYVFGVLPGSDEQTSWSRYFLRSRYMEQLRLIHGLLIIVFYFDSKLKYRCYCCNFSYCRCCSVHTRKHVHRSLLSDILLSWIFFSDSLSMWCRASHIGSQYNHGLWSPDNALSRYDSTPAPMRVSLWSNCHVLGEMHSLHPPLRNSHTFLPCNDHFV